MDYAGNSKKDKENKEKPERKLEKVTKGEVLIQKKSLGQKFKDVFVAADIKSVVRYVVYDICIPAAQNMFVDSVSKGVERMTYGERTRRPGTYGLGIGPRTTYNSPVRRGYSMQDNLDRTGLPPRPGIPTPRGGRQDLNGPIVVATKGDAEAVLEAMENVLDQQEVVTVGDLNSLTGVKGSYVDEKWGWTDLRGAEIQQIREGYLLDLPQPQPLT